MLPAIVVFFLCLILLVLIVASISRHKKSASGDVHLVGATALVDSELNPEGTVLVHGELWGALSRNGTSIAVNSRVHVVALRDHLLIVEPSND
jgi:membrane-bound serine protease (ClpP class)